MVRIGDVIDFGAFFYWILVMCLNELNLCMVFLIKNGSNNFMGEEDELEFHGWVGGGFRISFQLHLQFSRFWFFFFNEKVKEKIEDPVRKKMKLK